MEPSARGAIPAFSRLTAKRLVTWAQVAGTAFLVCVVFGGIVALQVDKWRKSLPGSIVAVKHELLPQDLDLIAPNLHHIWACATPHLILNTIALTSFGEALIGAKLGDWPRICRLDSDEDGATNGEELGDPCCTWVPGKVPPYRVWNLTHPGYNVQSLSTEQLRELSPESCEKSPTWEAIRTTQLEAQYYMRHESDLVTSDDLRWFKYPCMCVVILLLGSWIRSKGLLRDLLGVGPAACAGSQDLTRLERTAIYVGAYFWTDGVAGLTHLAFDFAPIRYPIVGSVAKGFQFHHYHPTAWVVVPFTVMLSHSLPLLGILSVALFVVPPNRYFRSFWTLTFVLCLITVLTHRWVHTPYEEGYWWFRVLQRLGVLMSHEHHMLHHDSLMRQFSNLSGVTDGILDYIVEHWLPATEYQHWLTVVVLYFAVPIAWGADRWGYGRQAMAKVMDAASQSPREPWIGQCPKDL